MAQTKKIVFVCEHGAAKSVIATAYFNKLKISDTTNTERIILFTKLPADFNTSIKTEDWSNLKDVDGDYPHRRDAIIKSINLLLDTLSKQN